ncbi:MAG: tRNA uridine-5-carboxymethylaminomethyl(34) synthesis GTPase MnmE [Micavibrio sp.]|nr:tRNA uridine-5-carboxymethylaminomethyl(34) synthesis GTPase MnmE [Micavibrio sp.]
MSNAQVDTIFALASGTGRAGVAVVRVSGAASHEHLRALCPNLDGIEPRRAILRRLKDPDSRETIDEALVLPFTAPASYTGENVVEYHLHGGRAVVQSLLDFLSRQPNTRMAEPGEFTRRAFENGKMDLTAAEAVADLIDAETQMQKTQALNQMGGALSDLYNDWSERLKRALAHMEADIEFPDEDMPDGIAPSLLAEIDTLKCEVADHLDDKRRGERLRDGIQIAIVGAPNAGKSSLLNALAQRDVAIISELAGTTRDVIEAHLDIGGYPVILADTAGLRPEDINAVGHDKIEQVGIKKALMRAQEADILLLLFDGAAEKDEGTLALKGENSITVINKCDLASANKNDDEIHISAATGEGLGVLLNALLVKIKDTFISREAPSLTRKRHRAHVEDTAQSLIRALSAPLPEMAAEDLRLAVRSLGKITGRVDVEDLLDVIFRDFCIGK